MIWFLYRNKWMKMECKYNNETKEKVTRKNKGIDARKKQKRERYESKRQRKTKQTTQKKGKQKEKRNERKKERKKYE
jgi:hypothetical protein